MFIYLQKCYTLQFKTRSVLETQYPFFTRKLKVQKRRNEKKRVYHDKITFKVVYT